VNFYKRFIGDIQAKTGGLTLAEFGAYDRLLDHLFSTETPIAKDEVYRICRAMGKDERNAVDKVLAKFFDLTPEGYTQAKALEEIERAQPLIEAARQNGKKGGRPRKTNNPDETQRVSKNNPAETQHEPSSKASQSQSQSHSPSLRSGEVGSDTLPGVSPALFADYMEVRRAKKAGKFTATAAGGLLREAERAGVSVERAVQACCEYAWIGFRSDWFAERQTKARPSAAEPAWRSEQRERTQIAAPGVASGIQSTAEFFDVEVKRVTTA
jgi:uncharacterized protein YdaU (DUF1376 family)